MSTFSNYGARVPKQHEKALFSVPITDQQEPKIQILNFAEAVKTAADKEASKIQKTAPIYKMPIIDFTNVVKTIADTEHQKIFTDEHKQKTLQKLQQEQTIQLVQEAQSALAKQQKMQKIGDTFSFISNGINTITNSFSKPSHDSTFGTINNTISNFADTLGIIPGMQLPSGILKVGTTLLNLINNLGSKTVDFTKNDRAYTQVGASYIGSSNFADKAVQNASKRYGLFDSRGYNEALDVAAQAEQEQEMIADIANKASNQFDIKNAMLGINSNRRTLEQQGGVNPRFLISGKQGMILKAKQIISAQKYSQLKQVKEKNEYTPEFKDGGSLNKINDQTIYTLLEVSLDLIPEFKDGGNVNIPNEINTLANLGDEEPIQKNVIPEGALHARLHHMENADNLTKKGIPVVSENDNGELEQQAEIERDEIIFRLEVTKQLENLRNRYNSSDISKSDKEQIAIEAGKLLVYEILENTIDNTGLLNTISD